MRSKPSMRAISSTEVCFAFVSKDLRTYSVYIGVSLRSIGLGPKTLSHGQGSSPPFTSSTSKQIKLFKTGYYVRLADLNRSNPFEGPHNASDPSLNLHTTSDRFAGVENESIPDGWYVYFPPL